MECFSKMNTIGENKPKRDEWALTGPYRSDMLEIMRLERVKDQKLMEAKKHMESFEMMKKRRGLIQIFFQSQIEFHCLILALTDQILAAGSLGRELNECDFERAENRHLTLAQTLQEEANDVGRNIEMIQKRVNDLRDQLRKDEHKPAQMIDHFWKSN